MNGTSLLVVAGAILAVLWASKSALALVAGMPLLAQILQILGVLYVAEMVMDAMGRPVQRLTLPPQLVTLLPTSAPAITPTLAPTIAPTIAPTLAPTIAPTPAP